LIAASARVVRLLYSYRRLLTLGIHGALALLAYQCAFLLRFEFQLAPGAVRLLLVTAPLVALVRVGFSYAFDLASARWRYAGVSDVLRLTAATAAGTALIYAISHGVPAVPAIPRSIIVLEAALTMLFTAGVWILYRTGVERWRPAGAGRGAAAIRVLVVGAGDAGQLLVREMTRARFSYRPICFVDDDPAKRDLRIHGVPVLGTVPDIAALVRRYAIQKIVVAVPSAGPAELRRIVGHCESADAPVEVLPGIGDVLDGRIRLSQIRELRIEDLLGREPVALRLPELQHELGGRSVLITGAAGSIGSELARQVALYGPDRLVLFDQAETPLFHLERELRSRNPQLGTVCIVGDILDAWAVRDTFARFQPSHVFHAAAYKHVSMMQHNVREAVRNNTMGTWRVAEAAGRAGAEKFVLVSTDKAVRPSSVMGASKRLAEAVVQHLQARHARTHFCAVRFGNVLGSNGSVVEIFRDQLRAGVPLTVTHADATRYFMTIPEAVQLILQASVLPETRGQIAMLEMGEPVRILELARNVLRISGISPREGENIIITGLLAGEKLHEELVGADESVQPTRAAKVRIVTPAADLSHDIGELLRAWERAFADGRTGEVAAALATRFPTLAGPDEPLRVAV
jgi:FlaA1/EpsC-like NDP-sugar epimerase